VSAHRISVVLPFRDAGGTLRECLDSVLAQTFPDFECLLIDDHSTDGSAEIVSTYSDLRLRLLKNPGEGLVDALNHGLTSAACPLIARMDADDHMYPDRLRRQFDYLAAHPGVALLATQVRKFPDHAVRDGYREYLRWQNACLAHADISRLIYLESPFAHPSVMFRRGEVLRLGGYRQGTFPEDYDLWLRMFQAGCRMEKLPEVLLDWRESEGRLSRVSPSYSREAFDALRAKYLARDARLAGDRPLAIWGAGRKTRRRVGHLLRRGFVPAAFIDIDPAKIGNIIDGVPVEAPGWLDRRPRPLVLVYVARHGARESIDTALGDLRYREGIDYLHVG